MARSRLETSLGLLSVPPQKPKMPTYPLWYEPLRMHHLQGSHARRDIGPVVAMTKSRITITGLLSARQASGSHLTTITLITDARVDRWRSMS